MRLFLAFFLFIAQSVASAQSLWSQTEYGMTVEQVKSVIPNAITPETPGDLYGGAKELLRLENVEIVNRDFIVHFYFLGGKLTQVTLSLRKGYDRESVKLTVDSLNEVLRAKYGREINEDINRGALPSRSTTWMSGRTNITVYSSTSDSDRNYYLLNIIYQVRLAREADKL